MKDTLWSVWYIVFVFVLITIMIISCAHSCEQKIINQSSDSIAKKDNDVESEETIKIYTETDKDGDTNQAVEPVSLGTFKLTAYCSCSICCGEWAYNRPNGIVYGAIGEELKEGYSIAVDPEVIPYGTEVIIDGKVYKAQDCGGAIKGNRIDVYFENHNDALEFGVQYKEVFVIL